MQTPLPSIIIMIPVGNLTANINARRIDVRVADLLGDPGNPITIARHSFGEENQNQVVFFSVYRRPNVEATLNQLHVPSFDIEDYDVRNIVRILWVSFEGVSLAAQSQFILQSLQAQESLKRSLRAYNLVQYQYDIFNGSEFIEGLLRVDDGPAAPEEVNSGAVEPGR